ncbi:MAG: universal stress protein [Desulfobacterales bacterium]|jgi:nucleotide-binding universal stress UspA family protein|nr:universal stress protein [Desulfobacterales bacterium]
MNKILIAVDDTKSSKEIFAKCTQICKCMAPEEIILLYVEKFAGRSLMDEMLGDAELSTLRDVIQGTEFQEAMDEKAEKILGFYKSALEERSPVPNVRTMVKSGIPAEEIVQTAKDEDASMIIIGSRGKRSRLFMGSVSREVANTAECPVMIVK